MIQFTIPVSTHGKLRKIKVYVYESLKDMYKATDVWSKRREENGGEHNYHAITHSFNKIDLYPDGKEIEYPNVGIIRLAKGYLSSYIIVHEVAHASLNIYQLDCLDDNDAVKHFDPSNETFCHIVSELEHNIVSKLNKMGAYQQHLT